MAGWRADARERAVRGRLARVQSGKPMPGKKAPIGYLWADPERGQKTRLVSACLP